jgi:hypothetical protein
MAKRNILLLVATGRGNAQITLSQMFRGIMRGKAISQ